MERRLRGAPSAYCEHQMWPGRDGEALFLQSAVIVAPSISSLSAEEVCVAIQADEVLKVMVLCLPVPSGHSLS